MGRAKAGTSAVYNHLSRDHWARDLTHRRALFGVPTLGAPVPLLKRTGIVGGPILREDGLDGTTNQVRAGAA
jgi:hypothetical protein